MTNDEYLNSLLVQENLTPGEVAGLQSLRDKIQQQLSSFQGSPRFYYAGSYAKRTMIRSRYDLDIIMYWPHDCGYTLKGIFEAVGKKLAENWKVVTPKTVAWELPFNGGFHVDVVPGRAQDATFYHATLYRRDRDSTMQTSIKVHLDTVRGSGHQDVIRLMKLIRLRRGVPFKTFVLELMTIEGAKGAASGGLERRLLAALSYIRSNIGTARIVDPANSSNVISDELSASDKGAIQSFAQAAIDAKTWTEVFR